MPLRLAMIVLLAAFTLTAFAQDPDMPDETDPAPADGASPAMPGSPGNFNVAVVAGRWTLQMSGIEYGIDLRDTKSMGDVYAMYPSNICAPGVGPVRSWQPAPNGIGIRLNDSTGRSIGEVWSYGPKRWKGKISGDAAVLTR